MSFEFEIKPHNIDVDQRLHDFVSGKTDKLDRYLNNIQDVRVELTHAKTARQAEDRFISQITLRGKGFLLRAEERAVDIYTAFDSSLDKIQRQIERFKGKRFRGRGDGTSLAEDALDMMGELDQEVEDVPRIGRRKKFTLIPMDEHEAIEQSQFLSHEDFFVFYNVNTNGVNVLYKRRDGSYGLIETEVG